MGNNFQKKNRKREERACEKIFKAVSSPLRNNLRVSRRDQSTDSATKTRPNPESIHVKFAEPSAHTAKPMSKMGPSGRKKKKMVGGKTDERFNDYIKRAKLKIRAMTNVGGVGNEDETEAKAETETLTPASASKDGGRDKFGEYIKKAKMKLRATSSIGDGTQKQD